MFRPDQIGIYFHWPFCKSKCPYCDFNVHVRPSIDHEKWAAAYLKSIEYYAAHLPDRQVVSVFFGGGTPSLMEPATIDSILSTIQKNWRVANDLEVTMEANPTSVEASKLQAFKDAGVNRVSLGVQSLEDSELKFLGRTHSAAEAKKAIEISAKIFDRSSFDLIYARPGQTMESWGRELKQAINYANGHLSLYQLTIERNTPFYLQYHRGAFIMPGEEAGADLFNLTQDILGQAGLPLYEISNHARPGQECRHNLLYWHYADYIGIGPGAHGRYTKDGIKYATRDHAAPEIWLERVNRNGHGAHNPEIVPSRDKFSEILMMGLRLRGGLPLDQIRNLSGITFNEGINPQNLTRAINEGWIEVTQQSVSLTREGMLRFNSLLPYILA